MVSLVDNAVKYTNTGSIRVLVTLTLKHLNIEVIDSGVGISESVVNELFSLFANKHSKDHSTKTGIGLDLCVSKFIAEFMGGSLIVNSKIGLFSKFTLLLPISKPKIHKNSVVCSKSISNPAQLLRRTSSKYDYRTQFERKSSQSQGDTPK